MQAANKHMNRCLKSLFIKKMQTSIKMRYTPIRKAKI